MGPIEPREARRPVVPISDGDGARTRAEEGRLGRSPAVLDRSDAIGEGDLERCRLACGSCSAGRKEDTRGPGAGEAPRRRRVAPTGRRSVARDEELEAGL